MKKFLLLTAVFLLAACNTNPPNFDDSALAIGLVDKLMTKQEIKPFPLP